MFNFYFHEMDFITIIGSEENVFIKDNDNINHIREKYGHTTYLGNYFIICQMFGYKSTYNLFVKCKSLEELEEIKLKYVMWKLKN